MSLLSSSRHSINTNVPSRTIPCQRWWSFIRVKFNITSDSRVGTSMYPRLLTRASSRMASPGASRCSRTWEQNVKSQVLSRKRHFLDVQAQKRSIILTKLFVTMGGFVCEHIGQVRGFSERPAAAANIQHQVVGLEIPLQYFILVRPGVGYRFFRFFPIPGPDGGLRVRYVQATFVLQRQCPYQAVALH
jgi:hypothetical protein